MNGVSFTPSQTTYSRANQSKQQASFGSAEFVIQLRKNSHMLTHSRPPFLEGTLSCGDSIIEHAISLLDSPIKSASSHEYPVKSSDPLELIYTFIQLRDHTSRIRIQQSPDGKIQHLKLDTYTPTAIIENKVTTDHPDEIPLMANLQKKLETMGILKRRKDA